jgi:hypothetical protein
MSTSPPTPRPGWSRRRKLAAAIVAGVLVVAVPVALAAVLARGELRGGGAINARPRLFIEVADVQAGTASEVEATAVANADGSATVSFLPVSVGGGHVDVGFIVRRAQNTSYQPVVRQPRHIR